MTVLPPAAPRRRTAAPALLWSRASRSFRFQLAFRFTAAMALGMTALSTAGLLAFRWTLDRELNVSLLNVASIQASSVTAAPDGEMVFHEWELTPSEAASVRDLNRYAQIWDTEGRSLLRTRYITADLPVDTAALRAAAAGRIAWAEADFDGIPVRSLYYPLGRLGHLHEPHILQVAAPLEARNRLLSRGILFLAALVVLVSATTFPGAWWLARRAIRPVDEIIDQAERIEASTLDQRITAYADTREYERLVQVLNGMLERLGAGFEAQRRFTADASHELRSPLTALRGEIELALMRPRSGDEYRRVLASALEETERLSRVADDLLTLARSDAGVTRPRPVHADLAALARDVANRLRPAAEAKGVAIATAPDGAVTGRFDPDLIERLLRNLIENAIRFTPAGGRIDVRASRAGAALEIDVADTGPGIPPADLERIFERFYTSDAARAATGLPGGTGLGLSIVRAIARMHGGEVRAENRPEGGALLHVTLPAPEA